MNKMNYYLEEAIKLKADGVIFHPIFSNLEDITNKRVIIHCSYSIEQLKTERAYPRSGRTYYRIVDGVKVLIGNDEYSELMKESDNGN